MGSLLSTERGEPEDLIPGDASLPLVVKARRQQKITELVAGPVEHTDARWSRTQRTSKLPIEVLKRVLE